MISKQRAPKSRNPERFASQISLRIPPILLTDKHSVLIPVYHLIQGLSMRSGYCVAGDDYLAGELSRGGDDVSDRTVRRRINALEGLGLIYREAPNQNRRLFPWHRYADKLERSGDMSKAAEITARALGKIIAAQGVIDFDRPPLPVEIPSDEFVAQYITAKFSARSFLELSEEEQSGTVSAFSLESVVDLLWLFGTNISETIWNHWRTLSFEDKRAVSIHAPRLVFANRSSPRFIPKLRNYLDPKGRAWLDPLPIVEIKGSRASGVSASDVSVAADEYLSKYFRQSNP